MIVDQNFACWGTIQELVVLGEFSRFVFAIALRGKWVFVYVGDLVLLVNFAFPMTSTLDPLEKQFAHE